MKFFKFIKNKYSFYSDLYFYIVFVFLHLTFNSWITKAQTSDSVLQLSNDAEFINEGDRKFNQNDFSAAVEFYSGAINRNPLSAKAYRNRGMTYIKLWKLDLAELDLRKSIELDPKDPNTYFFMGVLMRRHLKYKEAIEFYSQVIKINPNDPDAYTDRGLAKMELDSLLEALADFDKAILLNPKEIAAYINRGNVKTELLNFEGAVEDFNRALELNPNLPLVIANRGVAKINHGNRYGGCEDLEKAKAMGYKPAHELLINLCYR